MSLKNQCHRPVLTAWSCVAGACLMASTCAAAEFLHPMDFDGSDHAKRQVVDYIRARVRHDYCDGAIDMCQPTTLRMMENENLEAFKRATQATNRGIMDRVIKDYCTGAVDLCNYQTVWMMYQENLNASNQKLDW